MPLTHLITKHKMWFDVRLSSDQMQEFIRIFQFYKWQIWHFNRFSWTAAFCFFFLVQDEWKGEKGQTCQSWTLSLSLSHTYTHTLSATREWSRWPYSLKCMCLSRGQPSRLIADTNISSWRKQRHFRPTVCVCVCRSMLSYNTVTPFHIIQWQRLSPFSFLSVLRLQQRSKIGLSRDVEHYH